MIDCTVTSLASIHGPRRRSASCGDLSAAIAAVKAASSMPGIPEVPAALPGPGAANTPASQASAAYVQNSWGQSPTSVSLMAQPGIMQQQQQQQEETSSAAVGTNGQFSDPWVSPQLPSTAPPAASPSGHAQEAERSFVQQEEQQACASAALPCARCAVSAAQQDAADASCAQCMLVRVQRVAAEEAYSRIAAKLLRVEQQFTKVCVWSLLVAF